MAFSRCKQLSFFAAARQLVHKSVRAGRICTNPPTLACNYPEQLGGKRARKGRASSSSSGKKTACDFGLIGRFTYSPLRVLTGAGKCLGAPGLLVLICCFKCMNESEVVQGQFIFITYVPISTYKGNDAEFAQKHQKFLDPYHLNA